MKLKLTAIIILALFTLACAPDSGTQKDETATEETPTVEVTPDPPSSDATPDTPPPTIVAQPFVADTTADIQPAPISEPTIKFTVQISADLYFYKDNGLELWNSGNIDQPASIHKLGPMEYSVDDTIYTLDTAGNELNTTTLPKTPTAIKRTSEGVYWCYQYSKTDGAAMGGRYAYYSEFYLDDTIISEWYLNQTECRDIVSADGNTWAVSENGAYILISGTASGVMYVNNGEFFIHSRDTVAKTIVFNGHTENYGYNYISNAKQWIDSSGDYYSGNGYIWSALDGLREQATALNNFNAYPYPIVPEPTYGQAPVVIAAGQHAGKLYWIETNSGWLFEYDPLTDTLEQSFRLYIGDGMHSTGIEKSPFLKPFISEGILYFTDSGSIFEIDLDSGFLNIFYPGQGEVVKYD